MAKNAGWHADQSDRDQARKPPSSPASRRFITALTLDSVETNEFGARYVISVERQAAAYPAMRRKQTALCLDGR